jgi:hypothetical protein
MVHTVTDAVASHSGILSKPKIRSLVGLGFYGTPSRDFRPISVLLLTFCRRDPASEMTWRGVRPDLTAVFL